MDNKYIESLNSMFEEANPSQENLMSLMEKTLSFFQNIKQRLESANPEERQAALEETLEVKRVLEGKLRTLGEKTGMNPAQLAALAQMTSSFQEKKAMDQVDAKFKTLTDKDSKKTKIIV